MRSDSAPPTSAQAWNILVVDDEADVHNVTALSLKRRTWRQRPFAITGCFSSAEARELIRTDRERSFHVALVDVVMETKTSGLELCRYLRTELPSSLRIVLRTGQPGVMPEEKVLNEYDIDQYLSKAEVTPERLYSSIRTCLRSSQDIETLLTFHQQLRNFSAVLPSISTDQDLLLFMEQGLSFLELKHQVRITFVPTVDEEPDRSSLRSRSKALGQGHEAELTLGHVLPADAFGFDGAYMMLFMVPGERPPGVDVHDAGKARREGSGKKLARGGFLIEKAEPFMVDTLQSDLTAFMRNWTTAHGAALLQQRVAREKALSDAVHAQRTDRMASLVKTLADQLSPPLGHLASIASAVAAAPADPGSAAADESLASIKGSLGTMGKQVGTVRQLVQSFKRNVLNLAAEDPAPGDLGMILADCVSALRADAMRQKVLILTNWSEANKFPWTGVAGHLAQAVGNLLQNAVSYAYAVEGVVDVRLTESGEEYRIEIEDKGAGLPASVVEQLFRSAPTGEKAGGIVLANHIVTRLLKGQLTCTTEAGKGTKYVLTIARSS